MAGVMPTRRSSLAAMSHSQLPKTSWYLGSFGLAGGGGVAGCGPFGVGSILLMAW